MTKITDIGSGWRKYLGIVVNLTKITYNSSDDEKSACHSSIAYEIKIRSS